MLMTMGTSKLSRLMESWAALASVNKIPLENYIEHYTIQESEIRNQVERYANEHNGTITQEILNSLNLEIKHIEVTYFNKIEVV